MKLFWKMNNILTAENSFLCVGHQMKLLCAEWWDFVWQHWWVRNWHVVTQKSKSPWCCWLSQTIPHKKYLGYLEKGDFWWSGHHLKLMCETHSAWKNQHFEVENACVLVKTSGTIHDFQNPHEKLMWMVYSKFVLIYLLCDGDSLEIGKLPQ